MRDFFFLTVSPVQTCIMRFGEEICRKLLTERGEGEGDREEETGVKVYLLICLFLVAYLLLLVCFFLVWHTWAE